MNLHEQLNAKIPGLVWEKSFGDDVVAVKPENLYELAEHLKTGSHFDFLMNITGTDYPGKEKRFESSYEFFHSKTYKRLRVKTSVAEGENIPSLVSLWRGANWFEREVYDMIGIKFDGHPNMSRILTHHQFVGHPLRKDYPADRQQHCTESMPIHFDDDMDYKPDPNKNLVPINIGPAHPATHGTLRVMCELDGEKVNRANVVPQIVQATKIGDFSLVQRQDLILG